MTHCLDIVFFCHLVPDPDLLRPLKVRRPVNEISFRDNYPTVSLVITNVTSC